jgi:alpha-beta hydrolase superfamily lysophospholipase
MEAKQYIIDQKDGYKTVVSCFESTLPPLTTVLILHGMAEHKERYLKFINYLNENGMDAYIYNHRGHGTDKNPEELGFFDNLNGEQKVIEDANEVIDLVMKQKRCDKLIILGHSMGSLITRNVIQKRDNINGVILVGTTNPPKSKAYPGLLLAKIIQQIYGAKHRSQLITRLLFGGKSFSSLSNAGGKQSNSNSSITFDWLTRDKAVVAKYINDPYCGFTCTTSFYKDLIMLSLHAGDVHLMASTRRDLPIHLISGDCDPVGNNGKEVIQLFNNYQKLGFSKVDYKLYTDCRHELLLELNSDEVMKDIVAWIQTI